MLASDVRFNAIAQTGFVIALSLFLGDTGRP
jgi:hypothetical protein